MADDTNETSQLDELLRRGMRTAIDHDPQAAKTWEALRERIERERPAPPHQQTRTYPSSMFAHCTLSPCMQFTA